MNEAIITVNSGNMRQRPLIAVCGGRTYNDTHRVYGVLDKWHRQIPNMMVVQGGAKGADALAKAWCRSRLVPCVEIGAMWAELGDSAGPTRNLWVLDLWPNMVLSFPGGTGTYHMETHAERRGIPVLRV